MGPKSSKQRKGSHFSTYESSGGGGPSSSTTTSRYKSEREQNEEMRAKRVGMLCRWITECQLESEMLDFVHQLRDLCAEMTAKLFARSELQQTLITEAEKVIYATKTAMFQFNDNDALTIAGLEIFKLLDWAGWDGKKGISHQAEALIRIMESVLTRSNQENGTQHYDFSPEDLEKLLLCVEIIEGMLRTGTNEVPKEDFAKSLTNIFRALPSTARKEFRMAGFILTEKLLDNDHPDLKQVVELLVQDGLTLCDAIKPRWNTNKNNAEDSDASDPPVSPLVSTMVTSSLVDINAPCEESGRTPLIIACENSACNIVKFLLENGADLECKDKRGATALLKSATTKGHTAIVQMLLNKGGDILAMDEEGNNALHLAIQSGDAEIVEAILVFCDENQCGTLINARNNQKLTPLLLSVWQTPGSEIEEEDSKKIIRLLLSKGVDVNAQASNGASALILGVHRRRDLSILKLLIEGCCDVKATCQGLTAYDIAMEEGAGEEELSLLTFKTD